MSARPKKPTSKGPPPAPRKSKPEVAVGDDVATEIFDTDNFIKQQKAAEPAHKIQAVSMKTPGLGMPKGPDEEIDTRPKPKVKIRAMSELVKSGPIAQDLGRLAPPRDASAARARKVQDYVLWGSVSVILASIVALIIWFVAR